MLLWNMQVLKPRPYTLTKVSGTDQRVPAGSLAKPFVVLVKDQNGDLLEGEPVTFSVTGGGGTLSTETATTDADGRAFTTLTPGQRSREEYRNRQGRRVEGSDLQRHRIDDFHDPDQNLRKQSAGTGRNGAAVPFVVEVRDHNGNPLEGTQVTFEVTVGEGTLSATTATTDENGRAAATLTLGLPGANTVNVSVAGLEPVIFTATAEATPDFDGDGETGFSDFFLFADAFGGSDSRFDLDGSGSVDFADFFLLADYFADPAGASCWPWPGT